jgi:hypothetical protein
MCRNIKTLFNFDPPATEEEIKSASLQFVRKLSGFNKPSHINEKFYNEAVSEVSATAGRLLKSLKTNSNPRNREEEEKKAHERAIKRFGKV